MNHNFWVESATERMTIGGSRFSAEVLPTVNFTMRLQVEWADDPGISHDYVAEMFQSSFSGSYPPLRYNPIYNNPEHFIWSFLYLAEEEDDLYATPFPFAYTADLIGRFTFQLNPTTLKYELSISNTIAWGLEWDRAGDAAEAQRIRNLQFGFTSNRTYGAPSTYTANNAINHANSKSYHYVPQYPIELWRPHSLGVMGKSIRTMQGGIQNMTPSVHQIRTREMRVKEDLGVNAWRAEPWHTFWQFIVQNGYAFSFYPDREKSGDGETGDYVVLTPEEDSLSNAPTPVWETYAGLVQQDVRVRELTERLKRHTAFGMVGLTGYGVVATYYRSVWA